MSYKKKKTLRYRKQKEKKRTKKQPNSRKKDAGMLRALVAAAFLLFTQLYTADGRVIYTVCRGNTCRSPYYESMLRKIFGDRFTFGSFGTFPKTIGSRMAPETSKYAKELCEGDAVCENRVDNHSSKQIDCATIKEQIAAGEEITIIPMDESVEHALSDAMQCFTPYERSHIQVLPNANITDPFPFQKTDLEKQKYLDMKYDVTNHISNIKDSLAETPISRLPGRS